MLTHKIVTTRANFEIFEYLAVGFFICKQKIRQKRVSLNHLIISSPEIIVSIPFRCRSPNFRIAVYLCLLI